MNSWQHSIARTRQGFTIAEALTAVVLLGIVMAIAIPNVFGLQTRLKMMELDAQAEQVYNAVQYRLTALQSTGHLTGDDGLVKQVENDTNAEKLTGAPANYKASWSWDGREAYALRSDDLLVQKFLSTDAGSPISKALNNGWFIAELSPSTAEVYAVYYWEDDAEVAGHTGASISYDSVKDYRKPVEPRTPLRLGYYGGGELDAAVPEPEPEKTIAPLSFEVVNDEELYVKVSGGGYDSKSLDMEDYDPAKLEAVTFYVNGIEFTSVKNDGTNFNFDASKGVDVEAVVDSMRDSTTDPSITSSDKSMRYSVLKKISKNWNKLPQPGENADFSVKVKYEGSDELIDVPLENKPGIYAKTGVNTLYNRLTDDTVYVSSVRHLRNLNRYWAGTSSLNYTKIYVCEDIEFDGTKWKDGQVSILSKDFDNGNGQNPTVEFAAQNLGNSMTCTSFGASDNEGHAVVGYLDESDPDRKPHVLKNFYLGKNSRQISNTGDANADLEANKQLSLEADRFAGLFSDGLVNFTGVTFENVTSFSKECTGVFSSKLWNNVSLEDCHVTGQSLVFGTSSVGGFTAQARSCNAIEDCSFEGTVMSTNASNATGGFVGSITALGSIVRSSFDGTVIKNVDSESYRGETGGLAGNVSGKSALTVEDCTVAGAITGNGSNVGGLFGFAGENNSLTSVVNTTVTATVSGGKGSTQSSWGVNSYTGGFLGTNRSNTTFSGCSFGTEDKFATVVGEQGAVGGFVGFSEEDQDFADCMVYGHIKAGESASGMSYAGGIVGLETHNKATEWATISHCTVAKGSTVEGTGRFVGGFGGSYKGAANNSTTYATVTGGSASGTDGEYSSTGGAFGGILNSQSSANTVFEECYVGDSETGVDISATGRYVGGFAGSIVFGNFKRCGVFGATKDGSSWNTATVTGQRNVGGFVGGIGNSSNEKGYSYSDNGSNIPDFDLCFAAIDVSAANPDDSENAVNIGGFAGKFFLGPTVKRCYASGTVTGYSGVGGFAGTIDRTKSYQSDDGNRLSITRCYTTSDAYGHEHVGGFVGQLVSKKEQATPALNDCISYGLVSIQGKDAEADNVGGFCGSNSTNRTADNLYNDCAYLVGGSYNDELEPATPQPEGLDYEAAADFFSEYTLSAAQSHPYAASLQGKAFPFTCIVYGDDHKGLDHYGNWPVEG